MNIAKTPLARDGSGASGASGASGVKSALRTLQILEIFSDAKQPLVLSELERRS